MNDYVLVWNKNRRAVRVHTDATCPTLAGSRIPAASVPFKGPGTAGWLPRQEAFRLPGAVQCQRCV
jgi:hypothetical protein